MVDNLIRWVITTITSAGFLAVVAYLLRDTLARFFTKAVEHRFDKKIERFKADIRAEEKELDQIRTFIVSARRERDSGVQAKRFEAAEMLLANRQFLLEFYGLVDIVRMINFDKLIKNYDKNKVKDLIDVLIKPYNIDVKLEEYKKYDLGKPKLYLGERVIAFFEAYKNIIMYAVTKMKLLSIGTYQNSDDVMSEELVKNIQDLVPSSKELFERNGPLHALSMVNYFHKEVLSELRNDLFGSDTMRKDAELAVRLIVDANNAHVKVRTAFEKYGLSEDFLNKESEQ
ncbi:hypothetical protein ACV1E2_15745 [Klebsiella pneumoniae]|nr:hypothetical protein [Klebsiella pneumoniae]